MAHILIIDDEPHIRTIIKTFLVRDGHEVDLAENGKVALKLAELKAYDLAITDVIMPEKDGLEVITGFKRIIPGVRIIVMSGGSVGLDVPYLLNMAQIMGADRVLSKPIDYTELQTMVKDVLAL